LGATNHQHTLKINLMTHQFGCYKPPAHPEDKSDDSSVSVLSNHQHTLNMGKELVPEKSGKLYILTRLSARGNFFEGSYTG